MLDHVGEGVGMNKKREFRSHARPGHHAQIGAMFPSDGFRQISIAAKTVTFVQQVAIFSRRSLNEAKRRTGIRLDSSASGALADHPIFSLVAAVRLLRGCLMKSGVTQSLTYEYFVVKFDGLVQSGHRRFVDAVRAGLQLKDHFPQHDVKVDSIQVTDATEGLAQDPVLH